MNNEDAYTFLNQSVSSYNAARKYMEIFNLEEFYFNSLKSKFNKLKLSRSTYVKNQNIDTWNSQPFQPRESQVMNFPKKRKFLQMTSLTIFLLKMYALIVVVNM